MSVSSSVVSLSMYLPPEIDVAEMPPPQDIDATVMLTEERALSALSSGISEPDPAGAFEPLPPLPSPDAYSDSDSLDDESQLQVNAAPAQSTEATPLTGSFNNWVGADIYATLLDDLDALRASGATFLVHTMKLVRAHDSEGTVRTDTMDERVMEGLAKAETYLRIARNALSRDGGSPGTASGYGRSEEYHRSKRDLRSGFASTRAKFATFKARGMMNRGAVRANEEESAPTSSSSPTMIDNAVSPASTPKRSRELPATVRTPAPTTLPSLASTTVATLASMMHPPATSTLPTPASTASTPKPSPENKDALSSLPSRHESTTSTAPRSASSRAWARIRAASNIANMSSSERSPVSLLTEDQTGASPPATMFFSKIRCAMTTHTGSNAALRVAQLILLLLILFLIAILYGRLFQPSPTAITPRVAHPIWEKARARKLSPNSDYLIDCALSSAPDSRGVSQQGLPQQSRTYKQHLAEDKLREMAAAEAQAAVENTILVETLKDIPSPPGPSLPVRPNDLPGRDHSTEPVRQARPNRGAVRTRITLVAELNSARDLLSGALPSHPTLVFRTPPTSLEDPPSELDGSKGDSAAFRRYMDWVQDALWKHGDLPSVGDRDADHRYAAEVGKLRSELERLRMVEAVAWSRLLNEHLFSVSLDDSQPDPDLVDRGMTIRKPPPIQPFILSGLLMATVLHSLASVSMPQAAYILATLRAVLFAAFTFSYAIPNTSPSARLNALHQDLVKGIPLDIRTVIDILQLDPDILQYACCPACNMTYPPDKGNPLDPYPHHCTFRETDKEMCGALLVKKQLLAPKHKNQSWQKAFRALRVYPYRSLKSWLAELLGRPGMYETLRTSWSRPASTTLHDIMDAPAIRQFRGPDDVTYFSVQPDGSVHLVFSLFIDWFNPYGNKQAGKSHSIGVIYLACLNLPPHLRYRPENIFLAGIIPGPREPQLHEINHILQPLVDELLELWQRGVYLSETAARSSGCLVRAAVIPLVCDLPALRKVSGFASYMSKHFCSFCPLTLDDLSNLEPSTWPPARTRDKHLEIAGKWRDAATENARDKLFDDHGVRWSELLRLPYWDPTTYAVLDVMHNLFLGELHHHCRTVWKLDSVGSRSGGRAKPGISHTPHEQQVQLNRVYSALKDQSENALADVRKDYLSAVARFNQVVGLTSTDPTKRDYAKALLQWASAAERNHDLSAFRLPPVLEESAARFRLPFDEPPKEVSRFLVFTCDVLEQVRQDIESTTLPSWIEKAPSNFGSAGQGKLKADHWRTVCTINMVITLVRLWGTARSSFEELEALKNFLHLVIAVDLATRRSTNPTRAAAYEHHMLQYVQGLRSLYQSSFVPNHHLSLHLRPLLEAFGPVHGWWAFAFERYNGLLQRMKTNFKPAEMPKTFMRYFYMGGALRWLMRVTPWPKSSEFDDMLNSFEEAFSDRVRGTRVTQILSFGEVSPGDDFEYDHRRETSLPLHVYDALLALVNSTCPLQFQSSHGTEMDGRPRLHPSGQFVNIIHHDGIRFATSSAGIRDSFILYRHSDMIKAGQISSIFYHQRMGPKGLVIEPFFVINPYAPLEAKDAASDPYRCFPELETKLYYSWQQPWQDVVDTSAIVSHFAAFTYTPEEIGQPCVVARSLDRVHSSSPNRPEDVLKYPLAQS